MNNIDNCYNLPDESKYKSIREWREDDRPREKLIKHGSSILSDSELLAIIISSGTLGVSALDLSHNLLEAHQSLSKLASCDLSQYKQIKGIGPAKAVTLSAVFEIGRRIRTHVSPKMKMIQGPEDIANIYIPRMKDERRENFLVLLMNSSNQIFRDVVVSTGILNQSVVHPREVFRLAITESCASIVLLHNHPSGNPSPSDSDIEITKLLKEAGKIIDINVLDHIIVAGNKFKSLKNMGLM